IPSGVTGGPSFNEAEARQLVIARELQATDEQLLAARAHFAAAVNLTTAASDLIGAAGLQGQAAGAVASAAASTPVASSVLGPGFGQTASGLVVPLVSNAALAQVPGGQGLAPVVSQAISPGLSAQLNQL